MLLFKHFKYCLRGLSVLKRDMFQTFSAGNPKFLRFQRADPFRFFETLAELFWTQTPFPPRPSCSLLLPIGGSQALHFPRDQLGFHQIVVFSNFMTSWLIHQFHNDNKCPNPALHHPYIKSNDSLWRILQFITQRGGIWQQGCRPVRREINLVWTALRLLSVSTSAQLQNILYATCWVTVVLKVFRKSAIWEKVAPLSFSFFFFF